MKSRAAKYLVIIYHPEGYVQPASYISGFGGLMNMISLK